MKCLWVRLACTVALLLGFAPGAGAGAGAGAAEVTSACAGSSHLAGQCFTVHGRLTACTAVPNARIWIVGTKRVLGVVDAGGSPAGEVLLPPALEDQLFASPPCSKAAFGDFTVCPITRFQPGHMQMVCVVRATRVTVKDW